MQITIKCERGNKEKLTDGHEQENFDTYPTIWEDVIIECKSCGRKLEISLGGTVRSMKECE